MRSIGFRRLAFVLLLPVLPVAGCSDATGPSDPPNATVTFWTSYPGPSWIAVSLDGQQVGVLSLYHTSPPSCGTNSDGGTITITVKPGQHIMTAREVTASGTWGPKTFHVEPGACLRYALDG